MIWLEGVVSILLHQNWSISYTRMLIIDFLFLSFCLISVDLYYSLLHRG